jgi:hypothetical protein
MERRTHGDPKRGVEPNNALEDGFKLVDKHRFPSPPEELSAEEKRIYSEASRAMNRAYYLKEILGDDVSPDAAAAKFQQLAEELSSTDDGPWGEKSGELAEDIKNLVSPYVDRSVGIGNVLQAAKDMKQRPVVFQANVKMIKDGTLDPDVQAAINHRAQK